MVLVCCLTACERNTHVKIEGANTPVFIFSGSGTLACLTVYSPDYAEKAKSPSDEDFAVWKIGAKGGPSRGVPLSMVGPITYGKVPDGYEQIKPSVGLAVPLMEGEKYFYDVLTRNAPGAAGYLEIRNSQAIATDGPGICFGGEGKKWIRVSCPR